MEVPTADRLVAFTVDEYRARLDRIRAEMRRRGCDALVVDAIESINYLTGLTISGTRYQACLVFLDREPLMVLRSIDEGTLLDSSWLADYVLFSDSEDPIAVVARALEEHGGGGGSIGFELDSNFLTVRDYERLRAALPNASPVDFSAVIWELRLRKSDAEIAYIKRAASIADEAMSRALRTVKEGVSEREVAALIAATYMELGASDGHLGPVISGARTASIHGQLGERVLTKGDVFHIELVPEYRGYSARMMRSAVIGEPTVEQERAMRVMVEAQDAQIAAMQPGALACDVDHILRGRIIAAGLRERFDNVSGYTLGFYGTPRSPRASDFTRCFLPDADWRLEPRMAFHMYVFAAGLSLSETVLVGEDGPERLTTLDRRLFVGG